MNILLLFGIPIVVFCLGLLMDRGRKLNPWYIVEYTALTLPFVVAFGTRGLYGLGLMGIIYFLLLVLLYMVAKRDWETTFVPTGEIKFIMDGETVKRVIANVLGHHIEHVASDWLLVVDDPKKPREEKYEPFFTRWFGIYWVSAAFPLKRVYLYTFDWPRFITGAKPDEKKGSVRVISDGKYLQNRHEIVNSMRAVEQYVVEVPTVDLLGNMKAKVMVVIMVQAVRPAHAILTLHAEWLQLVIAFTQGQIMGFAADKDFDGMRIAIMQPAFSTHVMKDEKMHELERKTGVKIIQVYSVLFDLADASPAEMAAVSAKNVATLEADADVERGRGKGELAKGQIVGEAAGLRAIGDTVGDNHAARAYVIGAYLQQKGITGFDGNVLSLGGTTGTPILVNADAKEKGGEKKKED